MNDICIYTLILYKYDRSFIFYNFSLIESINQYKINKINNYYNNIALNIVNIMHYTRIKCKPINYIRKIKMFICVNYRSY